MAGPSKDNAFDHLVVVMFENRSFDNLLGRLCQPGEVAAFDGVLGKDLSNPISAWAEHGADRGSVPYAVATNMDTPNPDPGEEYTHTQLFGIIDPPSNRGSKRTVIAIEEFIPTARLGRGDRSAPSRSVVSTAATKARR